MARTLTPQDCYALINLMTKEARGVNNSVQAVDSSTFVSAGETLLSSGTENVCNTLSLILSRTIIATRPYTAKLTLIQSLDSGLFANRLRKISYYDSEAIPSGAFNTDINTNIFDGADLDSNNSGASVGSQWEVKLPYVCELNFGGSDVWDYEISIPEKQLQVAFTNEAEFAKFIGGLMDKFQSDMEMGKESWNRTAIITKIAATKAMDASMPGSCINVTTEFNKRYNTNYTSEQIRTTYVKEFFEFFTYLFKLTSQKMTYNTVNFHWTPPKNDVNSNPLTLSRHTPYRDQRVLLYEPLFLEGKSTVYSEIFNPQYLDLKTQYEGVLFWQNFNDGAAINCKPAIPDVLDPTAQTAPKDPIEMEYVIGMIFDRDSIYTDFIFDGAYTTPIHPRKIVTNTFVHMARNLIIDQSENTVIFYMDDSDVTPDEPVVPDGD